MAGSYYDQDRTKRILGIATTDAADDTLLDELGAVADQHIDNILRIHDEKIPLQSTNVLNDVKQAAAFYTASLFKGRQEDPEMAKHWKQMFEDTIKGIIADRDITGQPYIVERHNSRFATSHEDLLSFSEH